MEKSQIHSSIDWAKQGKHHGHLFIPYSYNLVVQGDCVACIAHDVPAEVLR